MLRRFDSWSSFLAFRSSTLTSDLCRLKSLQSNNTYSLIEIAPTRNNRTFSGTNKNQAILVVMDDSRIQNRK